ncbi:MAG: endonuclease/exonuclease/phosphatase family protein [Bacteroidota bacterium]
MIYDYIKNIPEEQLNRVIDNLLDLKDDLKKNIPRKTINQSLLLATWNIRDFDSNKFGHGHRLPESYLYIAEIISSFDLVAVQEINEDLTPLSRLIDILGKDSWDYIYTDMTEGISGNNERMCFIYDKRKVRFTKEAGQIVLTNSKLIQDSKQFARTPFKVSFQSGWFKFSLCTVHLYFGDETGVKLDRRIEEIRTISKVLASTAKREKSNIILLGDFNIVSPKHKTMTALLKSGFKVPLELRRETNMLKDKCYDQIAFMLRKNELQFGSSKPNSGVYDPFSVVLKSEDFQIYYDIVEDKTKWDELSKNHNTLESARKNYFEKTWRTFQISDHLPLWVELNIDFSDEYLLNLTEKTN